MDSPPQRAIALTVSECDISLASPLQHTLDHRSCPACDEIRRRNMDPAVLGKLPFGQAAAIWLDSRKNINDGHHSTRFMYEQYIKALKKFFGNATLETLADIGPIAAYQKERAAGTIPGLRPAGPSLVNHELNTLQQILTRAGLWNKVRDWYEPLKLKPSTRGSALTPEEKARIFRLAGERSRWLVAYCCILVSANTTADIGEILHLRLQDVETARRTFHIREAIKNRHRARTLPMNDDCLWAMTTLYNRALEKGSIYPHHYLVPARASAGATGYNPLKPMGSIRTAWEALRKAAGLEDKRLKDFRHTAITDLLSNPNIAERTVIELAGHVNNKMLDVYSHQRVSAKFSAVDALNSGGTPVNNLQRGPQLIASKKP
jgi:integrase